jgi:hypothetical protein
MKLSHLSTLLNREFITELWVLKFENKNGKRVGMLLQFLGWE